MLSNQKISRTNINVNDLSEEIHQNREDILGKLFREKVLLYQDELIDQDLGDRYGRTRVEASFSCPVCGKRRFTRKGRRERIYKCVLGKVRLDIVQVECRHCGHRFCPYKDTIGLAFQDRISPGMIERQLNLTCHIPYDKAGNFVKSCLGLKISSMKIRRMIDRKAKSIRSQPLSAKGKVVFEDSTKVKAGNKERGESIHLAISAVPGYNRQGRPSMHKQFLFLRTGEAVTIKEQLKSLEAKVIVHDGDMDLTGCAPYIQRCLWHLPHQLGHFLWLDGLGIEARKTYVKELINVLHHSPTAETMMNGYVKIINLLKEKNLRQSAVHLTNAKNEITIAKELGLPYPTTSPVEREMREINRRADVGARWSVQGLENLLLVKTFNKFSKLKE